MYGFTAFCCGQRADRTAALEPCCQAVLRTLPGGSLASPLTTHSNGTTNSLTGHGCPDLLFHGLTAVAANGLEHEGLDGAGTLVLHALDYQPPQAQYEPIGLLPAIDPPEQLRQWNSY